MQIGETLFASMAQQTSDIVKRFVEPGLTAEQKVHLYNDWAPTYDKTLETLDYSAPRKCAELVCNYFPNNRDKVDVLDIGTGTGLAAEQLNKKGFQIIDGLDPSEGLLKEAEKKKIFRKLLCTGISGEPIPDISKDAYDLVTVVGCYNHGHIPCESLREMVRVTKPGGIVCIVNRHSPFQEYPEYVENFFPLCDQLEKEGKWKKEEVTIYKGFLGGADGIIIVYRVQ